MQGISVYTRKGRPTFSVAYTDPASGERVFRSSGFKLTDPQGRMKAYAFAREQSQSGIAAGSQAPRGWDWVRPWLEFRFAKSGTTLTSYLGAWKFLSAFFHEHRIAGPAQLNYAHAVDFAQWREEKKKRSSGRRVCRNTSIHNIRVMSRIMREAVRRSLAHGNPWYKVSDDLPSELPPEKPEYTDADIARVRAELARRAGLGRPADWMPIAFEIALAQGCRLRATQIPMHKIDFDRWTIRFAEKGGKDFTVPVNPNIRPLLLRLRAEGRTVTCTLPRFASRNFGRVLRSLGLQSPPGMAHHTFHSTRVTVISRGARAGVPQQKMMRVVEHGSWAVHKRYTKLQPADVADVYGALALPAPSEPAAVLPSPGDTALPAPATRAPAAPRIPDAHPAMPVSLPA